MFFPRDSTDGAYEMDDELLIVHFSRIPDKVAHFYCCVTGYGTSGGTDFAKVRFIGIPRRCGGGYPDFWPFPITRPSLPLPPRPSFHVKFSF